MFFLNMFLSTVRLGKATVSEKFTLEYEAINTFSYSTALLSLVLLPKIGSLVSTSMLGNPTRTRKATPLHRTQRIGTLDTDRKAALNTNKILPLTFDEKEAK